MRSTGFRDGLPGKGSVALRSFATSRARCASARFSKLTVLSQFTVRSHCREKMRARSGLWRGTKALPPLVCDTFRSLAVSLPKSLQGDPRRTGTGLIERGCFTMGVQGDSIHVPDLQRFRWLRRRGSLECFSPGAWCRNACRGDPRGQPGAAKGIRYRHLLS